MVQAHIYLSRLGLSTLSRALAHADAIPTNLRTEGIAFTQQQNAYFALGHEFISKDKSEELKSILSKITIDYYKTILKLTRLERSNIKFGNEILSVKNKINILDKMVKSSFETLKKDLLGLFEKFIIHPEMGIDSAIWQKFSAGFSEDLMS